MVETDGIAPEFDDSFATPLGEVGEEAEEESQTQNDQLIDFNRHPGWTLIKNHMESRIRVYREPATDGANFEEIGRRYVVSNTIANELEGILKQMEALYEESTKHRQS